MIKTALLSDIHGNLVALDAVLDCLAEEGIEQVVCLGDVAIFGPQPREALARIHSLNCPVIMGNTDDWALDPSSHPYRDDETERFNAVELWGAAQLNDENRVFIRTFQPTLTESLPGGASLCCYHGSPRSYHDAIIATTPDDELTAMFAGHSATIMAGGHTHAAMVRRFQDMLIVNPGSVGLPYEVTPDGVRNPPWAEYAILTVNDADVSVELRRIDYDIAPLLEISHESGMPHAGWWTGDWR